MCGITGWVDFGRDLTEERATLETMTATLARRGVDGQGVWLSRHAGLGHTRTAVIDPPGGAQPFTAEEDDRTVAVLSYNGEVYNFRELRRDLAVRGHRFRTACDTEVVLRAYLEWGDGLAERIDGIFAFAVWDVRRERLVLVRDRLGVKPLFYGVLPNGLVFGSEPKALLAHPAVRPVVDRDGLRELFATAKQPGRAVFRDMAEVRPGQVVTLDRDGRRDRTYWRLEAREHQDGLAGTVRTVRSLLEASVARELVADVPLCTALSGGVDSSAVTALAARHRRAHGERTRTFVTTFDGYASDFAADDVRFTADEPYAAEVAQHLDTDHHPVRLGTRQLTDPATRWEVLLAQDAPTTLGDMDTSNYLTSRDIKRHSTVALTGEVADEVFGGYNWMFKPECVTADTFPWVVNETLQPGSPDGQGRALFDRGLLARVDMPGHYADAYHQAVADAPRTATGTETDRRMHTIGHLALTWWLPMLLDRADRLSMAHGLELRVPYADHRLVEYLYNVPWSLKTFDGREKSLLRAATGPLLPRSVLTRTKSPWPVTQDPVYPRALRGELAELLHDREAPAGPFLDGGAVRTALASSATDWPSRMHMEMALQFNSWLRHYRVELDV